MTDEARKAQREYFREWRKRNPDKVRATRARYWAKKAEKMAAAAGEAANQTGPSNATGNG